MYLGDEKNKPMSARDKSPMNLRVTRNKFNDHNYQSNEQMPIQIISHQPSIQIDEYKSLVSARTLQQ